MTKRMLTLLAVIVLAGSMVGLAEAPQRRSPAYQAEIEKVERWSHDFDGDMMILARDAGYDLGVVFSKALQGDNGALHDAMIVAGLVDGAAGESYMYCLTDLFRAVGDVRFGEQLAMEAAETRESVQMLLGCGLTDSMDPSEEQLSVVRSLYPITFQPSKKLARL